MAKVTLEEFVLNVYVKTGMASVHGFMEFSNLEFHENMKHCIVYCSGWQVVYRGAFLTIAKRYIWNLLSYRVAFLHVAAIVALSRCFNFVSCEVGFILTFWLLRLYTYYPTLCWLYCENAGDHTQVNKSHFWDNRKVTKLDFDKSTLHAQNSRCI